MIACEQQTGHSNSEPSDAEISLIVRNFETLKIELLKSNLLEMHFESEPSFSFNVENYHSALKQNESTWYKIVQNSRNAFPLLESARGCRILSSCSAASSGARAHSCSRFLKRLITRSASGEVFFWRMVAARWRPKLHPTFFSTSFSPFSRHVS